jgi:dihydrolipoamide dehydrogenase
MLRRSLRSLQGRGNSNAGKRFDVTVIGAGPSGITAALRAVEFRQHGRSTPLRVCLIEKEELGGADLWNGALQSKTMWEMAKFYDKARTFGKGIYEGDITERLVINEDKMQKTLFNVAETRRKQLAESIKSSGVLFIKGTARFLSEHKIAVATADDEYNIESDYFIIACGSVPRSHPQFPCDDTLIVSSDDIMKLPIPKSLVIVGAGVIGCEFASIYANFGKTNVRIIEKTKRMLPMEDEDIASYVELLLSKKDVAFHHECGLDNLERVEVDGQKMVRYTVKNQRTGALESHLVERALISIGRVPNYGPLALEAAGCKIERGMLVVDEHQRCKPHIYAVGDATVDIALVNMGETEAINAIDHIYKPKREAKHVTDNLSTIMFLDQEVAAVGLNEQSCRKANIAYVAARYGYDFVTRAIVMGAAEGFVKIIVSNDRQKTVLGVRAVGAHASSIVELASLAIHNNQSVYDLCDILTAYPAMTQGFQECLRMLIGRSILKPNVFKELRLWEWVPPGFAQGRAYTADAARQREKDERRRAAAAAAKLDAVEAEQKARGIQPGDGLADKKAAEQ